MNCVSSAVAILTLVLAGASPAADSPYAGADQRAIKALAPDEVADLTAGHGMGLAMAADLNHYPGPRHVLDLADALGLTAAQRTGAEALFAQVKREATTLGRAIVDDERTLDGLFAAGTAELGTVDALVAEIAARRGKLRFVHLAAHVKMRALLTPQQIATYDRLRGYGEGAGDEQHHHQP